MYEKKYLKYKKKYLKYKYNILGGSDSVRTPFITLYSFIIETDNEVINIIPTHCYDIKDAQTYIIFYNLIYTNKLTGNTIETEIEIPEENNEIDTENNVIEAKA
jgi:hypothetical protein